MGTSYRIHILKVTITLRVEGNFFKRESFKIMLDAGEDIGL